MNYGPIPDQLGCIERLVCDYGRILASERLGVFYDEAPTHKLEVIKRLQDALVIARIETEMECCEHCGGTGAISDPGGDPARDSDCPECELAALELERIKDEEAQLVFTTPQGWRTTSSSN